MEFRRVVIYSADVAATVMFYRVAFGLFPLPVPGLPLDDYTILNTGATLLVVQSLAVTAQDTTAHFTLTSPTSPSPGIELSFIVPDVEHTYAAALAAGACALDPPLLTRWGQLVAHLRDPNGIIISLIGACHELPMERTEHAAPYPNPVLPKRLHGQSRLRRARPRLRDAGRRL